MVWIIISAVFAFVSGLSEKIIDLIHFKNNFKKGKFKKTSNWLSFIIFVVAFITSLILITSQKKKSDRAAFVADSLRRADAYIQKQRTDSLKKLLSEANDTISSLNAKAQNLVGNQIRLLTEQKTGLLKTAYEIKAAADSLNKILTGTDGLCFVEPKDEENAGCFFSLNNINKYSLRYVYVFILDYRNLDSCVILFKNKRILDLKKQQKSAIFYNTIEQLGSGLTFLDLTIAPSVGDHRYYIRIEIGNNFYIQELYVSANAKSYSYRLYKVEPGDKLVLVRQSIPERSNNEWKKIFNFNYSNFSVIP